MNASATFPYTHAALSKPLSTVILDFGGVLGLPQDPVRARNMAALCGLSLSEFTPLYQRDRLEFDRGSLTTEQYWSRIYVAAGREPTPDLIARIEEEDSLGWTRVNQRMVAWADELRSAGFATAILSNMPADKLHFMRRDPSFDWMKRFPVAVFSCDYRLVKPEPAVYETCLRLLGRSPAECLFLDDSPVNVEGGLAVGLASLLFRSVEEAAPLLAERWALPVRSLRNGAGG